MKPTKCPAKEKKNEAKKLKKRGGEKAKSRTQDCCLPVPKILLSVHAGTSQANILHLDQKAVKCMTCKWLYGKF